MGSHLKVDQIDAACMNWEPVRISPLPHSRVAAPHRLAVGGAEVKPLPGFSNYNGSSIPEDEHIDLPFSGAVYKPSFRSGRDKVQAGMSHNGPESRACTYITH